MNNLSKGLFSDCTPETQPENTYRYAVNMVDTNSQELENERSCIYRFGFLDASFIPMGSVLMDDGNFCILTKSFIGIDCQIVISNGKQGDYNVILAQALDFDITTPIKVIFRRNYKNERIIYWTDGVRPYRYFNLDRPDLFYTFNPITSTNDFDLNKLNIFKKLNDKSNYPVIDPAISIDLLDTGGNLLDGAYQFVFSFGTKDYSYTNWGVFTNPIYVNNKPKTYSLNTYNGSQAGIESTKAIHFKLTQIDTSFEYIKIGVIKTINGVQTCVKSLDIPYKYYYDPGVAEYVFEYTYANDLQFETATLAEFTVDYTPVTTGKTLEQFNNRLFLANYSVAKRDLNYQSKANNITTEYITTERDLDSYGTNAITGDYHSERTQFYFKTYMRDEVYALSLVWVYDDLSESFPYHIPGRAYDSSVDSDGAGNEYWINHNTGDSTSRMAYWQSDLVYPEGFDFPTTGSCPTDSNGNTLVGTAIRHHKFPNASKVPFYDYSTNKIKIIGLEFSNIELPDAEYQEGLIGYKIVYADRNLKNNKSVFGQGVHIPLYFSQRDNAGQNDNVLISNLFWGSELDWKKYTSGGGHSNLTAGSYIDPTHTDLSTYHYAWYSPEIEFHRNFGNAKQAIIEAYGVCSNSNYIKDLEANKNGFYNAGGWVNPKDGCGKVLNYFDRLKWQNTTTSATSSKTIEFKNFIEENSIGYYNDEGDTRVPIPKNKIENLYGTSFLATKFATSSTRLVAPTSPALADGLITSTNQNIVWVDSSNEDLLTPHYQADCKSAIYVTNLVNKNFNQYGPILSTSYNCFTGYYFSVRNSSGNLVTPGSTDIYGGDTYINKYSFKITSGGGENYYGASVANDTGSGGTTDDVIQMRLFTQVVLESSVNINFRHSGIDEVPSNSGVATQYKYFDSTSPYNYGALWSYLSGKTSSDNAGLYNSDYSILNQLKTYIHKQTIEPEVTQDITGILYSELQTNTSIIDYYLQFKPANYTSIPKSSGEITDLVSIKGNLYAHTTNSLWDLNTQPKELELGDTTAVIGTGSLFSLPPVPINKMQTSEAGLQTLHSNCTSEAGYLFPDVKATNLNLLTESGLDEVSRYGMFKFFNENLEFKLAKQYNQIVDDYLTSKIWTPQNYAVNETVVFNAKFYLCIQDTGVTDASPTDTDYWEYTGVKVSDLYYTLTDDIQNPMGTGIKIAYDDVFKRYIITKKDFSFSDGYLTNLAGTYSIDFDPEITVMGEPVSNPNYLKVNGVNYFFNNSFTIYYTYTTPDVDDPISVTIDGTYESFRSSDILGPVFVNECWTISYYPYKKQFSSFYSYQPDYLLFKNNFWYSFKYDTVEDIGFYYEHNLKDSYCRFYDNDAPDTSTSVNDSYIDIIKQLEPNSNWFASVNWHTKFKNTKDQEMMEENLSYITISNSHQLSNEILIDSSDTTKVKKTKELTIYSGFRDFKDDSVTSEFFFVKNPITGLNVFNPLAVNILTNWTKQKRFNDVYLQYRLHYNNENNYKLKLIVTDTYENPSIR